MLSHQLAALALQAFNINLMDCYCLTMAVIDLLFILLRYLLHDKLKE